MAEARLIDIYRLIGLGDTDAALKKAEVLVRDFPTFGLAHLVHGDLLAARVRPLQALGDVPGTLNSAAEQTLRDLRAESAARMKALRERPPPGTIPTQLLQLSAENRHAIAVDSSRSRLYLFENRPSGPVLVNDYYISVGKAGIQKKVEGDARTPLGVYFITSALDPRNLKDYYGSGALPINYPNVLDLRRGQTGSGIWLHGTPPNQFSRPPLASDGCVVLANPDLERVMRTVKIRSTPVVIAQQLKWVKPQHNQEAAEAFEQRLRAWARAKSAGDLEQLSPFYAPDFQAEGQSWGQWLPKLKSELAQLKGRELHLKNVSLLHWKDADETMVVTFGEVASGARSGTTRRQYWMRQGGQWKIIYEGVLG